MYVVKPGIAGFASPQPAAASTPLVYNKYFVDEIYDATVVNPLIDGSRTVLWNGVDAGLDRRHGERRRHSRAQASAALLRLLQSGNIRSYATWVVFGARARDRRHGRCAGGIR